MEGYVGGYVEGIVEGIVERCVGGCGGGPGKTPFPVQISEFKYPPVSKKLWHFQVCFRNVSETVGTHSKIHKRKGKKTQNVERHQTKQWGFHNSNTTIQEAPQSSHLLRKRPTKERRFSTIRN